MSRLETSRKLDCLDGLRGLAILLVILYHMHTGQPTPYRPAVAAGLGLFRYGYSGVSLFLVLSGFCLTHSMLRRHEAGRPQGLGAYLSARWWRIAPPYYAAMVVYLAFPIVYLVVGHASPMTGLLEVRQVLSHLLFLHGLWGDTIEAINTPFWSLSLEFQFYLLLPWLFLLAKRYGTLAVIAGMAASSVAWRWFVLRHLPGQEHLINGVFLGRWTEFALGLGVAFWFHATARGRPTRAAVVAWSALAVLGLLAAAALASFPASGTSEFAFGLGYAALLAAALESGRRQGRLDRALGWPPLVWVGMVSYSLYLIHPLFVERGVQAYHRLIAHSTLATDLAALATVLAGVIGGGWAFYRIVEHRFVRSVDAPGRGETAKPAARDSWDGREPLPFAALADQAGPGPFHAPG